MDGTAFRPDGKTAATLILPAFGLGIDNFQADRSPDHKYRTTPLRRLRAHAKGGYCHDGRYATPADVVNHYNQAFDLRLPQAGVNDLVEYVKSL